jgi:hypothetical protein
VCLELLGCFDMNYGMLLLVLYRGRSICVIRIILSPTRGDSMTPSLRYFTTTLNKDMADYVGSAVELVLPAVENRVASTTHLT